MQATEERVTGGEFDPFNPGSAFGHICLIVFVFAVLGIVGCCALVNGYSGLVALQPGPPATNTVSPNPDIAYR